MKLVKQKKIPIIFATHHEEIVAPTKDKKIKGHKIKGHTIPDFVVNVPSLQKIRESYTYLDF